MSFIERRLRSKYERTCSFPAKGRACAGSVSLLRQLVFSLTAIVGLRALASLSPHTRCGRRRVLASCRCKVSHSSAPLVTTSRSPAAPPDRSTSRSRRSSSRAAQTLPTKQKANDALKRFPQFVFTQNDELMQLVRPRTDRFNFEIEK